MSVECTKCMTTPPLSIKNQTLYIGVGSNHLYNKLTSILGQSGYAYKQFERYFTVNVDCLQRFILRLQEVNTLSSVEMADIYLLPVDVDTQVTYGDFMDAKNVYYWITLYQNRDIVEAIKMGRIKTLFQPIIQNGSGKSYGHEALSRAYNANNKAISTERLFSVSKKLEMLYNLDRQCRIASIENASKMGNFTGKLFINFIPTVIYDPNVCLKTTHEVARKTQMNPKDIVFEVVESEFVEDYNHLAKILEFYRDKGYQTALDDVGSGFSTLSKHAILKTDYVKIDREVIQNIHQSKANQTYLNQVLELKRQTGIKIIAEGVETEEEYLYIKQTEVDLVQGFYFARPSDELHFK